MKFTYEINDKIYFVKGITFEELKFFQMWLTINDNIQIDNYFNNLVFNNKDLNIFQKAILILYSLMLTTKNKLQITLDEEKPKTYIFHISNLINKIKSIDIPDKLITIDNDLKIILGIPHDFFYILSEKDLNKKIIYYNTYNYITKIVYKNDIIDDKNDKIQIINNLPAFLSVEIDNFEKKCNDILKNIYLYDENINITCNVLYFFENLKKIFEIDYNNLIKLEYNLYNKVKIQNIDNKFFNECELLIKLFDEDMQEQKNELNKQKSELKL